MARKVRNITNSASSYDIISQTPGNYTKENYFLKELQEKVNADWCYRPNRVTIEYESEKASPDVFPYLGEWKPIEVVEQTVKSDKGNEISQDYLNLVFRDISEKRFTIGSKFRIGIEHNIRTPDDQKTVWLVYNTANTSMTKSVAVRRCNGVLGSTFKDAQGITHYHYEPVIQNAELTNTGIFYNQVANALRANMVIVAQDNESTRSYKINQRFIIGATFIDSDGKLSGQVYRINAVQRANSNSTYDPENLGLVHIYLEITEVSEYDNFETRIAYQEQSKTTVIDEPEVYDPLNMDKQYFLDFEQPIPFPLLLGERQIVFIPVIKDDSGNIVADANQYIQTLYSLENCPLGKEINYINFEEQEATDTTQYQFMLQRKKIYLNGDLIVTCRLPAEYSPNHEDIIGSFKLVVREQEA